MQLSYQVRGQDDKLGMQKLGAALERTGREFADFGTHYWPRLESLLEQEISGQFAEAGRGPHRGKWAPLSPAYAKQKALLYPGRPLLVRTGALRDALIKQSAHALRTTSGDRFQFGTSGLPYASTHQVGGGGLPDRPIFDFSPDFEKRITQEAAAVARELARKGGIESFADIPSDWGSITNVGAFGGAMAGLRAGAGVGAVGGRRSRGVRSRGPRRKR